MSVDSQIELFDLSRVPFMDSAGIGALVGGIRRPRELGGDVAVACDRPALLRLLRTTGLDRIATTTHTVTEAAAELAAAAVRRPSPIAVDRLDDDPTPERPRRQQQAGWLRAALRLPTYLYRWHLGWLLGQRFLLLTHHGRRSGRQYQTVLEVIGRTVTGELTVMSGWGRQADWYRNIQHQPCVQIIVGRTCMIVAPREVPTAEAVSILAAYEHRNRIASPVIRRVLSALVGWRYDGRPDSRQRLVQQLPLIAFTPQRPSDDLPGDSPTGTEDSTVMSKTTVGGGTVGVIHHVELWVPDLGRALDSFGWLFETLGYLPYQNWSDGRSWILGHTYVVVEQSPAEVGDTHNRLLPGLNHLAFHAGLPEDLDEIVSRAQEHGWSLLFPERHPHAGGSGHYAAYLANVDGFEVELVAATGDP